MTRYALALAALALAGCAGGPKPAVPTVAASEAALAASGHVILVCYAVAPCAAKAPKAAIKADYDAAYSAVTAAQATADAGGSPDMTASASALAALQSLVATLPTATP